MKTYLEFIKENKNSVIGLAEVEKTFKLVFDEAKVSSVKSLYEKDEETEQTKLIISINNLFTENTNILYTKFVFVVDDKKTKLKKNDFSYLYEINKGFKTINFEDSDSLQKELQKIIDMEIFGNDLKALSDNSVTLSTDVNKWLGERDINNTSVYSIKYSPLLDNTPSDSLFFRYKINLDDTREINLNIRKIDKNDFKISFKENDWSHSVEIDDLSGLVQTIGETIKNYII